MHRNTAKYISEPYQRRSEILGLIIAGGSQASNCMAIWRYVSISVATKASYGLSQRLSKSIRLRNVGARFAKAR